MALMTDCASMHSRIMTALAANLFFPAAATTVVGLFQNNIVPNLTTTLGDLTVADFTGYAPVTVTAWDATHLDPITGEPVIESTTPLVFTQTGTTIVNTIYGLYLEDGSGNLLSAEKFDTPIQMDTTGKQINALIRLFTQGMTGPDAYED
jgi:hypothetical protein